MIVGPARAAGLLGMIAAGLLLGLSTSASSFALAHVERPALRWTPDAALAAALSVPLGTNVFAIETADAEARLESLPAVAAAHVSVSLPDGLVVAVDERQPILAWQVGATVLLVDREGSIFAVDDQPAAGRGDLPTVVDRRAASQLALGLGGHLDPVDLDVATRLAAIKPADIASRAARLQVAVDDQDGFTMTSGSGSWIAVFGFYGPALRTTELIPGQVQLLASLLPGREPTVARVILADDRTGTYVPKPTGR